MEARRMARAAAGLVLAYGVVSVPARAALSLVADLPGVQPVGTPVTWSVQGAEPDTYDYRLSIGRVGGPARIVFDYSSKSSFRLAPLAEGSFSVAVAARSRANGQVTPLSAPFEVAARATSVPVVSATDHPLVALYSAPTCTAGRWMRVHFITFAPVKKYFATDWRACDGTRSMNVYLAGMLADTDYFVRHELNNPQGTNQGFGPTLTHRTGALPPGFVNLTAVPPTSAGTSFVESMVLAAPIMFPQDTRPQRPLATDLNGRVLWYYDRDPAARPQLWRPVAGGTLLVNFDTDRIWQGLREIDLAGNVVRETTAARISEQLIARGQPPITSIHHEARRLANGYTAILGSMEQMFQDVQGASGPVDLLADAVIVLDRNWQVVWSWNAFEHMDIERIATLDEKCGTLPSNSAGCPPITLVDGVTTLAKDWLHTNSIAYSPADGNLLISMRHQDWVLKLDYRDGAGNGAVLWRLGPAGDFTLNGAGADAYPWFSHQHDANYFATGRIVLYDNGNVPCALGLAACVSRGQTYHLDETNMTATRELNAGLGVYAEALGSAQALRNGNFYFHNGLQQGVPPVPRTRVVEVTPAGSHSYVADIDAASYRSFRVPSLYIGVPGAPN